MKDFLAAIKNNLANLFSIIGIALTIYFSVFYVPQYSREISLRKIEGINEALKSTIQELVYNEHDIDENDLMTMVKGKELRDNIVYPYTIEELLIQTQESFLDNNFIPLDQRKKLVEKIDEIRSKLNKVETRPEAKKKDISSYIAFSLSALGIFISMLGMVSVWSKYKKQKEYDVEDKIEKTKNDIQFHIRRGFLIENFVFETLKKVLPEESIKRQLPDIGLDFLVDLSGNRRIGIEIKYTETSLIPIRTIKQLIEVSRSYELPIILVTNAELTANAYQVLQTYNKVTPVWWTPRKA